MVVCVKPIFRLCLPGWLACLMLAALAAALADEPAVNVTVVTDGLTIFREAPGGKQRMVLLRLERIPGMQSSADAILSGLELRTTVAGVAYVRPLLPIRGAEVWDTIWLPERMRSFQADVQRGGATLWTGVLRVSPAGRESTVIPMSPTVKVGQLKPLMLRGTNYYPRRSPWPGLWRDTTEKEMDGEFGQMNRLHINAFRTFYNMDEEAKLTRRDGAMTPLLISRINRLLTVAQRHRLKVIVCNGGGPHMDEVDTWQRFFRFGVEPFAYDGRVLMWDLINEPGGGDGPKATPTLADWIRAMYPELQRDAPGHTLTVGLAWQFDQLWDLGVKPPVAQYHNYSGAVGVQPPGQPPVRNIADDLASTSKFIDNRPLIIGEFGYATVPDDIRKDAGEARQLSIYQGVLTGSEAAVARGVNLVGVFNWTLFDFIPDWMGKGEQSFGIVRVDSSLKPSGKLLQDTYARWQKRLKASWE